MFADILSQFRQTSTRRELDQDYRQGDYQPVTLIRFLRSPLPIILLTSTGLIVAGMLIMINLSAHNRQMLENLHEVAKPQTIQTLMEQNQWSIEDRKVLHEQNKRSVEDRKYLYERLEVSEKNQAKTQKALENAQRSFNEARDVLRRLEKSKETP